MTLHEEYLHYISLDLNRQNINILEVRLRLSNYRPAKNIEIYTNFNKKFC